MTGLSQPESTLTVEPDSVRAVILASPVRDAHGDSVQRLHQVGGTAARRSAID